MALEGDQVFQLIATAMTTDFPTGLAVLISEKLDKQYQPKDIVSSIEMDAKLMRVKMNIKESPVELFNRLASIKIAHSTPTSTILDEKFFTSVICATPSEYNTSIQNCMKDKGNAITLDNIQEDMLVKFRFINTKAIGNREMIEGTDTTLSTETGLASIDTDVTCYACVQKGHNANDPN